jgi:hypothetical protein
VELQAWRSEHLKNTTYNGKLAALPDPTKTVRLDDSPGSPEKISWHAGVLPGLHSVASDH